jgi:hypothetical protein
MKRSLLFGGAFPSPLPSPARGEGGVNLLLSLDGRGAGEGDSVAETLASLVISSERSEQARESPHGDLAPERSGNAGERIRVAPALACFNSYDLSTSRLLQV